jgi:putative ABC transport system permease protein
VVARTSLPPDRLAAEMRSLMRGLDPAVALDDVRTMRQLVDGAAAQRRFQTLLVTACGGVGLLLSVERRTAEIGIRMALGAQRRGVMRLILKQGASLALAGIGLGLACAWGVTRWMTSLLFEVAPADAPTFCGAAVLFCAVALAACYVPAHRATRVDTMVSLR